MANFDAAATCLAGTFTGFITQEVAKFTEQISSIVASFTDPLDALAETSVNQIVDGVSDIASGSVVGNLASIGSAIVVNKVKRELADTLKEVIQREPGIGDFIQRITNVTEAVYGIVSLAVMLRKEAPYAAVKVSIDELNGMLDAKEAALSSLSTHLIQLNNVVLAASDNPSANAEDLKASLVEASEKLGDAVSSFLSLEVSMSGTPSVFVDKEFDAGIANLAAATTAMAPPSDVNILDVVEALEVGLVGAEYLTQDQIKTASYAMGPLTVMSECELQSIEKSTRRINVYLEQLEDIVPSYESAVESTSMKNFRVKLVRELRLRIQALKLDIDASVAKESIDALSLHSLSWGSRLQALNEMAPKIENKLEAGSSDQDRLQAMQDELQAVLDALDDINGDDITEGIEDTTTLRAQVGTVIGQAKVIASLMGTSKVDNVDLETFQLTMAAVVKSGSSAISESIANVSRIRSALALYKTEPPLDQRLDDLLSLLDLLGMGRAKNLLKLGKFKDFLDTTIDDASYVGVAIKCIIQAEAAVADSITLSALTKIRESLEAQKVSELSAAFDILDSGKNAAILEITTKLEDGQAKLDSINQVIKELQSLAEKAGEAVTDITAAAEGLDEQLGELATGAGGSLNSLLSDLDVDGLQSGCRGQLRF